ncbi:MAG: GYD domain-containing protein [Anaerolineae bacterium]|jgi:uncharacterized protein with GYD domain
MPTFMSQWRHKPEALSAMSKGAIDSPEYVARMVKALGGELLCYYHCYGPYDGMAIARMPDGVTNLASVLAALSVGATQTTVTTQLFDAEEMATAARQAADVIRQMEA